MPFSKSRGQASLEMVVGLIILLVVAGVVIGLVMQTMSKSNLEAVSQGDAAKKFIEGCSVSCDTKNTMEYCTAKFSGEQWNKNDIKGELVNMNEWDFCEDGAYCFLVTDCDEFGGNRDIEYCRKFLCQTYINKYGNAAAASTKLKEIFSVSQNLAGCCRKEKDGSTTCYSQLSAQDKWFQKGFGDYGFCGSSGGKVYDGNDCGDGVCDPDVGETASNCPDDCTGQPYCGDGKCDSASGENEATCSEDCGGSGSSLTFSGCAYDSASGSMTCNTNCKDTGTVIVAVSDGNKNAQSMGGDISDGTMTISGGKITVKPVLVNNGTDTLSYPLSDLSGPGTWTATLFCADPDGYKILMNV